MIAFRNDLIKNIINYTLILFYPWTNGKKTTFVLVVFKGDNSCSTDNNQTSHFVKTTAGLIWVSMYYLSFCILLRIRIAVKYFISDTCISI